MVDIKGHKDELEMELARTKALFGAEATKNVLRSFRSLGGKYQSNIIVLQKVLEVKAVSPNDQRNELTDLLIVSEDKSGNAVSIRISDYLSAEGGYSKIQKYYQD